MKARKVFARILAVLFLIFLLMPFLGMLVFSVFSRWPIDSLLPQTPTFRGFTAFFLKDAGNALSTALFSVAVGLTTLVIGIPAAKGLAGLKGPLKAVLDVILVLPMLLPVVSVSIGSHKLFLAFRLTGSVPVFIMHLYFSLPYAFKILYSAYRALGNSFGVTARNLGAGPVRSFLYVEAPVFLPAYTSAFIMGFVVSYSQYFINLLLGGAKNMNYSVILSQLLTGSDRHLASVYSLMYLLFGGVAVGLAFLVRSLAERRVKYGRA